LYGGTDDEKPKSEYSFHCLKTIDNETYYVFAIKRWEKRYTIDVPYLTLEIPGPLDDSIPLNTGVAAALISPDILPWEKLSSPVQSALHVFVPPHAINIPRKGLFYHYWTNDLKFVPITLTTAKKLRFKLIDTKTLNSFPLLPGYPIWLKLILRGKKKMTSPLYRRSLDYYSSSSSSGGIKEEEEEETRIIQLHSPDGPSPNLEVVFTSPLQLPDNYDWEIALTSLSFPDCYDFGLTLSERTFRVYKGSRLDSDFKEFTIILPTSLEVQELAILFEHVTNGSVKATLSWDNRLKFLQGSDDPQLGIVIHTNTAKILGIPFRYLRQKGFHFNAGFYDLSIPMGDDWIFPEAPSLKHNRPHIVKISSPDIKPSSVDGKLEPLLKMVPIFPDSPNQVVHVNKEWNNFEYHKITPTRLKSIKIQLTDSSNLPVKFDLTRSDQTVHASVQLRIKKKSRESFFSS
jgi:hypothetical protein